VRLLGIIHQNRVLVKREVKNAVEN